MTCDVRIACIGTYIPRARVSNEELATRFEMDPAFLRNKIGIAERAVKSSTETTSDLCVGAFADLQRRRQVDFDAVRVVCVVTQNPDRKIPHTAAIVHQRLGLGKHCLTFDISQGCAGHVHGVAIASSLLQSLGGGGAALLFTCDPYSVVVDPTDKATALLFGDAASVSYLSTDEPGYAVIDSDFGTVPNTWECLMHDGHRLKMDGRLVFSNAAREVPASIQRVLSRNELTLDGIDQFLLHPGSKYIVDHLRATLGLPPEKVPFDIAGYGNTVSSSIPIMLAECFTQQRHTKIISSGFGVGFSWGTNLMEFRP
ncbi:ketoacyl-ACP synthase III [Pendulispora brunnea]|uniref:Ketoacyl-ACP synthase III n=1 Tax=Pendulispora brunnea TaxID=2905690 RepID=A0ABZ2JYP4_9BACT